MLAVESYAHAKLPETAENVKVVNATKANKTHSIITPQDTLKKTNALPEARVDEEEEKNDGVIRSSAVSSPTGLEASNADNLNASDFGGEKTPLSIHTGGGGGGDGTDDDDGDEDDEESRPKSSTSKSAASAESGESGGNSNNNVPRGNWTTEEDEMLRQAVELFSGRNWKKIASMVKDRTDVQCLHRWQKVLRPGLIKGPWSAEEDASVIELVRTHGVRSWSFIAKQLTGRLGKQCRERWYNHLNPDIIKAPWTAEEDAIIIEVCNVNKSSCSSRVK